MALDLSYKGRSFEPFTFEVERGKIRELCQAIGDKNQIFFRFGCSEGGGL